MLFDVVRKGDADQLKTLLEAPQPIHWRNAEARAGFIFHACSTSRTVQSQRDAILRLLRVLSPLTHPPLRPSSQDHTPLYAAAKRTDADSGRRIALLIDAGARVNDICAVRKREATFAAQRKISLCTLFSACLCLYPENSVPRRA